MTIRVDTTKEVESLRDRIIKLRAALEEIVDHGGHVSEKLARVALDADKPSLRTLAERVVRLRDDCGTLTYKLLDEAVDAMAAFLKENPES